MAQWARRGRKHARYFDNVQLYASMRLENGALVSGLYLTFHPIATEVDEAVQGFLDGVRIINVPNDRNFCAAVRQKYAAAQSPQSGEVPA